MHTKNNKRADQPNPDIALTRRDCFSAFGAVTGTLLGGPRLEAHTISPVQGIELDLHVNGKPHKLRIDPRMTLLDLLREQLHLTGTKKGCDHGQCGACTVLANGRRINSCLSLAATHEGGEITTIEGLATPAGLHPLQTAFIEQDGLQCGYCTPGQVCSAVALLAEARRGDASAVTADLARIGPVELTGNEIRERMSGNICRCGAYPGIVAAIESCAGNRSPVA
jgi:xanthine dehydrogenase YagT iron-sulfur-binding subunit